MKALLSICLFGGLLSPGALMSCHHCLGEDCAAPGIQKCNADQDACASAVLETTLVNSLMPKYHVTTMQCSPASFCLNSYGSISTLGGGFIRSNVQCCYSDMCNKMTASLPVHEERPPNGKQCPSCVAFNSTECREVESMNCTGGETKCLAGAAYVSIDAESSPDKVKVITKRQCSQDDGDLNVETGESKFSTFWAPPFLDKEKEVGGQGNRT